MNEKKSLLFNQVRELIGICASVASNCLPWLRYHFAMVLKAGCSLPEIEETIQLAKMVKERPIGDIYKLMDDLIHKEKGKNDTL